MSVMCESCQNQRATVHLTDIPRGKEVKDRKELHLCDDCARQKGIPLKAQISIQDLMATIAQSQAGKEQVEKMAKLSCDVCGISYLEFRQGGRLGCPHDYDVFEKLLQPFLERVHTANAHVGKTPSQAGRKVAQENELIRLKMELGRAIEREDYEKAAALRDQLKRLEESGGAG